MESEFREDQKQKSKEIANLSREIQALKVTLIGIDGQNGMRSQILGLSQDINEIKNSLNQYLKAISDIKAQEARYDLIFATKRELRDLEEKICKKITDLDDRLEAEAEQREEERKKQEMHNENLSISKKALIVSILALLITSTVGIFV
jgi:predicted PilT family ATPase